MRRPVLGWVTHQIHSVTTPKHASDLHVLHTMTEQRKRMFSRLIQNAGGLDGLEQWQQSVPKQGAAV